jgi:hypothetical protein
MGLRQGFPLFPRLGVFQDSEKGFVFCRLNAIDVMAETITARKMAQMGWNVKKLMIEGTERSGFEYGDLLD